VQAPCDVVLIDGLLIQNEGCPLIGTEGISLGPWGVVATDARIARIQRTPWVRVRMRLFHEL
jgi:hypothetical protein